MREENKKTTIIEVETTLNKLRLRTLEVIAFNEKKVKNLKPWIEIFGLKITTGA